MEKTKAFFSTIPEKDMCTQEKEDTIAILETLYEVFQSVDAVSYVQSTPASYHNPYVQQLQIHIVDEAEKLIGQKISWCDVVYTENIMNAFRADVEARAKLYKKL